MTNSAPTRIRHESRRRILAVKGLEQLTSNMVRVRFSGDLEGFVSAAADDHIKLFFFAGKDAGLDVASSATAFEGAAARDFTPRRFDRDLGELVIDFALHDNGVAVDWVRQAEVGQRIGIGGPRSSFVVADDFDWYLLIGDEAALPAIGRRLEELRPGVPVFVIASVAGPADVLQFKTDAAITEIWVHRPLSQSSSPHWLLNAISELQLPSGAGFVWAAGESSIVRSIRQHFVDVRGLPTNQMRAAGYWRKGDVAIHEPL